jgi:hypothetical protein
MKECPECGVMYAEEDGRGGTCRRCYERHQTGSMEKDMSWFAHQAGEPEKKF